MSDNIAPAGKVWFCMACGKRAADQYGEAGGWDESCMLNSILIGSDQSGPSADDCAQFNKAHEAALARSFKGLDDLIKGLENRTLVTPPALLALAQRAADAIELRRQSAGSAKQGEAP